ncbi:succinate dehydrogenase / fumarate reductase flavoprotein subunit [Streptomyces sp. SAI-127]|nr:FAD-binding protein [Streptomyces sp. SAI-127]MDH6493627.1 succinate dehydrogenase / fumarate reductase flavoprotein subunit [Streptomyces sp. SAI-127]
MRQASERPSKSPRPVSRSSWSPNGPAKTPPASAAWDDAEWAPAPARLGDTGERHSADTSRQSHLRAALPGERIAPRAAAQPIDGVEPRGRRPGRTASTSTTRLTGPDLHRALRLRGRQLAIPVLPHVYVTRLLVDNGTVFGAYGFGLVDGSGYLVHADAVILATGGHTRIWRHTSSRRHENTGGSLRLAAEAGARLRDPDLVQFHSFGLIEPDHAAGMPVSDSARHAGGVLLNNLGERFMTRYDTERMELSAQETVTRASYTEIQEGRGSRSGSVWLELSHLPVTRSWHGCRTCTGRYWNCRCSTSPATPSTSCRPPASPWAASGSRPSDVDGLFAVGEAAGGPHRPEEDSLSEVLTHGRIAGSAAVEYSATLTGPRHSPAATRAAEADVLRLVVADGDHNARALQRAVRRLMTDHAGVVRDEVGLVAGLTALDEIKARTADIGVHIDIGGFADLAHAYDLGSAVLATRAALQCARERLGPQDCHHRSDRPGAAPALADAMVWSATTSGRRTPLAAPTGITEPWRDASDDAGPAV